MTSAPTPDVAGYLKGIGVSIALTTVSFVGLQVLGAGPVGVAQVAAVPLQLMVGLLYVLPVGVVAGPLGAVVVHLTCRHVRRQWVHVLVAGLAGLGVGALVALGPGAALDGLVHPGLLALLTGASAAAGRAAVRPRTPVDDDFAGTPPRW